MFRVFGTVILNGAAVIVVSDGGAIATVVHPYMLASINTVNRDFVVFILSIIRLIKF